jgi:hypothetical protein
LVVWRKKYRRDAEIGWAARESEERFLHYADRHFAGAKVEEKASVCFGRNDKFAAMLTNHVLMAGQI